MLLSHRAYVLLGAGLAACLSVGVPDSVADTPGTVHSAPFLERTWAQPTVREEQTRNWLDKQVLPYLDQRGEAVLLASSPLAVRDKVLFRSHWGVHAVNLRTGKLEWESDSRWSVDRMLRDPGKTGALTFWLNAYLSANQPTVILDNSLVGNLSTDGRRLFAVEDFQVAPFRVQNGNPGPDMSGNYGPGLGDALLHSRLQAFDLVTGKLIWELGARHDADDGGPAREDPADLAGSYFLSAPLVLEGKLYVLNEKEGNLRLACLEPAHGEVQWLQHLASIRVPLNLDPLRRMRADALAYADGVMVCPTNAGFLLALHLQTRTLLWAHDYRDPAAPRPDGMQEGLRRQLQIRRRGQAAPQPPAIAWKFSPPLIHKGKVVFTPLDGASLFCLDLRDGSTLWETRAKQDDLYVAGIFPSRGEDAGEGRILVVSKRGCRALSLATGKQLWTLETGLPSGRGASDGSVYFLPLREAVETGGPEVCAIDVERGLILAHTPSRKKEIPGNLLFHDGMVVSQTAAEVAAYPQLKVKMQQIDGLLDRDPHNGRALLERGELKLSEGDRTGAVADLHAALETKPPFEVRDKAQAVLFESLTELLERDFTAGEKYLEEYGELCRLEVPEGGTAADRQQRLAEQQRRQATVAFILARGREGQGRLLQAVRAYLDALLGPSGENLIANPDDPAVKVSRTAWAGAHLAALLARATDANRGPINEEVAGRWRALQDGKDPEMLQRFVRAVGDTAAGQEARRLLAERLDKQNAFLAAEQVLLRYRQLSDPAEAGRALEALARLYAGKALFEDAAFCYRELGRQYASTVVRDGKTGSDLVKAAAADPQVARHLEETDPVPPGGTKVQAGFGNFGQPQTLFALEPEGPALPFFHRHRVVLDLTSNRLRVLDRDTLEERAGYDLPRTSFVNLVNSGNPQVAFRPRFQTIGHLIVVNLGHLVFGLDPIDRRVLWEKSLLGPLENLGISNVVYDPQDGKPFLMYQDGWTQKLGQIGVLGSTAVCLQTRAGLLVVDPFTGGTLWSRSDVPARTLFLGDARHLVVVEGDSAGQPSGTRAFRSADGASEAVTDCSAMVAQRLGNIGHNLLLGDTNGQGEFALHLLDTLTGKDVWEKRFPADSRALLSEDPTLTGAVDPEGRVTILDGASGRRLSTATVNPKDLGRATPIHLLQDRAHFYLAWSERANPMRFPNGLPVVNALAGSGLRGLPVSGKVYAFDRITGKENWEVRVTDQVLFVDEFAELPVLIFSSRHQRVVNNNGQVGAAQSAGAKIISKRTGKLLYDEPDLTNAQPFHAVRRSADGATTELVGTNFRIVLAQER
jgi:outer membrane protein assembly factor BamB